MAAATDLLHHTSSLSINNSAPATLRTSTQPTVDSEDKKAREAANKFEALLIHNMLKSMRKTTMAQDSSNQKNLYNDMLDERLAETMIKAGGLGVADQIYAQIRGKNQTNSRRGDDEVDLARLQLLARSIDHPNTNQRKPQIDQGQSTTGQSVDISQLRMATSLWSGNSSPAALNSRQKFLQPLLPHAEQSARRLGTSANAVLAIAALETGWGKHMIKDQNGISSNNLFGIKATASDNRFTTTLTTEYINGDTYKLNARFKKYESLADSVKGFADFILQNPRYSQALENAANPERFLQELQKAGYATDPNYASKAISVMRQIPNFSPPL